MKRSKNTSTADIRLIIGCFGCFSLLVLLIGLVGVSVENIKQGNTRPGVAYLAFPTLIFIIIILCIVLKAKKSARNAREQKILSRDIQIPSEVVTMMYCVKCGALVTPGNRYCTKCGNKTLTKKFSFCTLCGQPVDHKTRFCTKCGSPIISRDPVESAEIILKSVAQLQDIYNNRLYRCEHTETISDYFTQYDMMINTLQSIARYNNIEQFIDFNPELLIESKEKDFQWKLRNTIERQKNNAIKNIQGLYKNSKEHQVKEYEEFCNSMRLFENRFSDETKEFAIKSANEISQKIDRSLARQALFSNYGENTPNACLIDEIDRMNGLEFESLCADLLCQNGFVNVSLTPGSGDQGVDVLAEKDGIRYAIQCKCYSKDLGNTPIQEVHTGKDFYGCHVGVVMTNRYFTPGAIEAAKRTNTLLWDRNAILEMMSR